MSAPKGSGGPRCPGIRFSTVIAVLPVVVVLVVLLVVPVGCEVVRMPAKFVPEIELRAVIQCIVEGDLGNRRLDQHLQGDDVELAQHPLDCRVFARRGVDQQRVVAPVGDDPDAAFRSGPADFGLRRQRFGGGIGALARGRAGLGRAAQPADVLRGRCRAARAKPGYPPVREPKPPVILSGSAPGAVPPGGAGVALICPGVKARYSRASRSVLWPFCT